MIVVGAGLIGVSIAWLLQRSGHRVLLVAPQATRAPGPIESLGGSEAALGLLLAQVFQRNRGRAWRLRQESLELWSRWRCELAGRGRPIPWRPGLLLLAASEAELERQRRLVEERRAMGLPLELWSAERLQQLSPALPAGALAGLHSPLDGQLDAAAALAALQEDALAAGLERRSATAVALQPATAVTPAWRLQLDDGSWLDSDWLVLAAGIASAALLQPLGLERPLQPVLGQALELETAAPLDWHWPGAVSWQGLHLVPRPDRGGRSRLWLGATLEPGERADAAAATTLRTLAGAAPAWLRQARLQRHWLGIRPRPLGRPAPLLERLAPGLLLCSGHYRNGVLLAPASASWVRRQLQGDGEG